MLAKKWVTIYNWHRGTTRVDEQQKKPGHSATESQAVMDN